MVLRLRPIELRDANAFVARLHRHSKPVRGQKFSVAVENGELRGVAIAGRPVARGLDNGNACSILYGACCRAAAGMGYRLAVTYTLETESGASLRAAGFRPVAEVRDRQWDCASRPREERDLIGDKVRWERALA